MDKKIDKIIKFNIILGVLEFIVLTFTILSGLEFRFKKWNWITIIVCVSIYIIIIIAAIIYDNIGKTKVSKEELIVSNYYKEQAQLILNVLDNYLEENSKIANDLKLYWPFFKGILKRVANGKKLNGKDYGVVEKLKIWQEQNYDDPFLINIYDVLKNNIISTKIKRGKVHFIKINNFKHSLWGLLLSLLILIPVCIGIVVLINAKELIGVILYFLFLILVIIFSSISLVDIQWANIYNDKIVVRNIFGVVKEIEYKDINKSFKINATIFSIKMLGICKPYIVLSRYKSLQKSQIGDAYNRKKYKYVILPMSIRNEKIIKEKYKACTGNELNF